MKPIEVLNKFFEARDVIHLAHLNTTSFAEHKALGKFYEGWTELMDDFIETYQGRYTRVVGEVKIGFTTEVDVLDYLKFLRGFMGVDAPTIIAPALDTDLANILADMLGLINHTLYLLTLK